MTRGIEQAAAAGVGLAILVTAPDATGADVVAGWAAVAVGLAARGSRPGNPTWLLTVVLGLVWWLGCVDDRLAVLYVGVLLHLLLTIPSGRARTWPRRSAVVAGYVAGTAFAVYGPVLAAAALWIAAAVVVAARWRAAGAVGRRALQPQLVGTGAVVVGELVAPVWPPGAAVAVLGWAVGLGVDLLRRNLDRAAVHDLVAALRVGLPPGRLQAALAAALHDPTLRLAYRLSDGGYVDVDGAPVDPGPPSGAGVTRLDRDDREVGLLVHDAALADQPDLVQAVRVGAAIALENERLQAEIRSRVREVEASRARIIEAADAAREQLERDLGGGVARRLASVASLLRTSGDETGPARAGLLAEADAELAGALAELRELARGIYPVLLTDAGLGPALASLADRSTIATHLDVVDRRFTTAVEQGCYALVAAALRRTEATGATLAEIDLTVSGGCVRLRVRTDGQDPLDPLPGARDRAAALDGTLLVDDAGSMTVELPVPDAQGVTT